MGRQVSFMEGIFEGLVVDQNCWWADQLLLKTSAEITGFLSWLAREKTCFVCAPVTLVLTLVQVVITTRIWYRWNPFYLRIILVTLFSNSCRQFSPNSRLHFRTMLLCKFFLPCLPPSSWAHSRHLFAVQTPLLRWLARTPCGLSRWADHHLCMPGKRGSCIFLPFANPFRLLARCWKF